ncbi:MAG: phage holin family protein [Solirubrobacterales bacterium]
MAVSTHPSRRRPPFWMRVVAAGAINLAGLWLAGALDLIAYDDSVATLLVAALVLAAINILVRPALVVLSIPLIIATLGFFVLVVNALMLWLTGVLVPGFALISFWRTIGAAIILWLVNMLLGGVMRDFTEKPRASATERY